MCSPTRDGETGLCSITPLQRILGTHFRKIYWIILRELSFTFFYFLLLIGWLLFVVMNWNCTMQARHQYAELIWLADLCGAKTAGLVLCWLLGLGCCCRMELWWFESLFIPVFIHYSIFKHNLFCFWFPCTVFINGILVKAPAFYLNPKCELNSHQNYKSHNAKPRVVCR